MLQITESEVDRQYGNGDRGEKLQYRRTEEGHTQHLHGSFAKLLGGARYVLLFGLAAAIETQRGHAPQTIEKMARQAAQRLEVASIGIGSTDAGQDHKQRDQRGCCQQDQTGCPIDREYGQQDQQRLEATELGLRQVAGVEVVQILHLLVEQAGPAPGGLPLQVGRSAALHLF